MRFRPIHAFVTSCILLATANPVLCQERQGLADEAERASETVQGSERPIPSGPGLAYSQAVHRRGNGDAPLHATPSEQLSDKATVVLIPQRTHWQWPVTERVDALQTPSGSEVDQEKSLGEPNGALDPSVAPHTQDNADNLQTPPENTSDEQSSGALPPGSLPPPEEIEAEPLIALQEPATRHPVWHTDCHSHSLQQPQQTAQATDPVLLYGHSGSLDGRGTSHAGEQGRRGPKRRLAADTAAPPLGAAAPSQPWLIPGGNAASRLEPPFHDSVTVIVRTLEDRSRIFYTLDGSLPSTSATLYQGQFVVSSPGITTVSAAVLSPRGVWSPFAAESYLVMRSVPGVAYGGYLAQCTVGLDFDGNGWPDQAAPNLEDALPGDPVEVTLTSAGGSFLLLTPRPEPAFLVLLPATSAGGSAACYDVSTGLPQRTRLRAPPGFQTLSSVSTLTVALMGLLASDSSSSSSSSSELAAVAQALTAASLTVPTDFATRDAMRDALAGERPAQKLLAVSVQLATLVSHAVGLLGPQLGASALGIADVLYEETARAMLVDGTGEAVVILDFTQAAQVGPILLAAVERLAPLSSAAPSALPDDAPAPSSPGSLGRVHLLLPTAVSSVAAVAGRVAALEFGSPAFVPALAAISKTAQGQMAESIHQVGTGALAPGDFAALYDLRLALQVGPDGAYLGAISPPPPAAVEESTPPGGPETPVTIAIRLTLAVPAPAAQWAATSQDSVAAGARLAVASASSLPPEAVLVASVAPLGPPEAPTAMDLRLSCAFNGTRQRETDVADSVTNLDAIYINSSPWNITRMQVEVAWGKEENPLPEAAPTLDLPPPPSSSSRTASIGELPWWGFALVVGMALITMAALFYACCHTPGLQLPFLRVTSPVKGHNPSASMRGEYLRALESGSFAHAEPVVAEPEVSKVSAPPPPEDAKTEGTNAPLSASMRARGPAARVPSLIDHTRGPPPATYSDGSMGVTPQVALQSMLRWDPSTGSWVAAA